MSWELQKQRQGALRGDATQDRQRQNSAENSEEVSSTVRIRRLAARPRQLDYASQSDYHALVVLSDAVAARYVSNPALAACDGVCFLRGGDPDGDAGQSAGQHDAELGAAGVSVFWVRGGGVYGGPDSIYFGRGCLVGCVAVGWVSAVESEV